MPYDADLGRYRIDVRQETRAKAADMLRRAGCRSKPAPSWGSKKLPAMAVAVHFRGKSAKHMKDLEHAQASLIFAAIKAKGRVPILLNSAAGGAGATPLPSESVWGGDAETLAAVIGECEAFVGIDSGPGKAASATDTPTLIVWTKHHPLQFHDPAPNTTHLVFEHHMGMVPIENNLGVAEYFSKAYKYTTYERGGLVENVVDWLGGILK